MKVLIAFVVCCISSIHAAIIKNEMKIEIDACLIDYGIEPEAISNGSQELTEEQMSCVGACIYKSKGIMNSDGTINEEVIESYFGSILEEEIFQDVYNSCKDRTNCQFVQCMLNKLKSNWDLEYGL